MDTYRFLLIFLSFAVIVSARKQAPAGSALETVAAVVKETTKTWVKLFNPRTPEGLPDNCISSALGAQCLLAWLYFGADGDSKAQIKTALGYTFEDTVLLEAVKQVQEIIANEVGSKITYGHALFLQKDFLIKEGFLKLSTESLKAEVQSVDFATPKAAKVVNSWVNELTEGQITKVNTDLPPSTVVLLLGVLHFKGKWAVPFPPEATKKDVFQGIDGKNTSVDFISRMGEFIVIDSPEIKAKIIDIPYDNPNIKFTLVLPNEGETVDTVALNLVTKFKKIFKKKQTPSEIELSLPKFKFSSDFDLTEGLKTLGIVDIFDPAKANLTQMTDKPSHIDKVFQSAAIELTEEGTEVSSVTGGRVTRIPEAKRRKGKAKSLSKKVKHL